MIPLVIDTNILFSAMYNPKGTERKLLDETLDNIQIQLFAPEIFRDEICRTFTEKLDYPRRQAETIINNYEIILVEIGEYQEKLDEAKKLISHISDAPFVAVALHLNAPIWSGNKNHFKSLQNSKKVIWFDSKRLKAFLEARLL